MKDIQSQSDNRRINIRRVGIKEISYPITVLDKARQEQKTVARVNMYVNLPHQFKGTHMSRFIEILNRFHGRINLKSFHLILEEMKMKLQAEAAHMEIEFPYFLKKKTDPLRRSGLCEYLCKMHGSLDRVDDLTLDVRVPIAPPMPEQSGSGLPESLGHWGSADVCLRFRNFIWIEDLIKMVEEITSHNLQWSLDTPKPADYYLSVEKIARALGEKLGSHPDISWFEVRVENLSEGFSTFAVIRSRKSETRSQMTEPLNPEP